MQFLSPLYSRRRPLRLPTPRPMSTDDQRSKAKLWRWGAILTLTALVLPLDAWPAAPMHPTQAPGYYRFRLGEYEVTALLDGTHPFPAAEVLMHPSGESGKGRVKLFGDSAEATEAKLAAAFVELPPEGSINAFLINTGQHLILLDSGAGTLYGACCGHLLANLRAAGYQPEQVDLILLTHLHADHVGGIAPGGVMAFKNATVRVRGADLDYWTDPERAKAAPAFLRPMFAGAVASLRPYITAGRVSAFDSEAELLPGILATPAPGHTPGHTLYTISSHGQRLMVWGDIVHVAALQFADPSITVIYDSDQDAAAAQRTALLKSAADGRTLIAAAHIAFPGIGHVVSRGSIYAWLPSNYTTRVAMPTR